MKKTFFTMAFFAASIFVMPNFASAEVRINEVAWMGTSGSQYEEWIELYNDGATQALDGWKIYKAGGGTVLINLSGSISGGAYLLVCRTTASLTNPLSGDCDIKGAFGGSGLNNTSEHIILKDGSGSTVEEINASSGWPAGDSVSKYSMQKYNSSWITAAATPRSANATTGSGGNNGNNNSENENNNADEEEVETTDGANEELPEAKIYTDRILKTEAPSVAIAGSPAHFKAQALDYDRSDIFKGHYTWNMGDGSVREFALGYRETNNGFDYSYEYPGVYSVSVKYYHSYLNDVPPELEKKLTIEVVAPTIMISKIYPDGAVELKNASGNVVDLSNWQLRDSFGKSFIIPEDSLIAANKTIVFSSRVTKLNSANGVNIFTPTNSLAASSNSNKSYPASSKTAIKKQTAVVANAVEGEVLAAETTDVSNELPEKSHNKTFLWILIFVVLIAGAIVAALFLRKVEKTEEGYELIDE